MSVTQATALDEEEEDPEERELLEEVADELLDDWEEEVLEELTLEEVTDELFEDWDEDVLEELTLEDEDVLLTEELAALLELLLEDDCARANVVIEPKKRAANANERGVVLRIGIGGKYKNGPGHYTLPFKGENSSTRAEVLREKSTFARSGEATVDNLLRRLVGRTHAH